MQVQAQLSGTTATLAALHGNILTVANVGDSRVILGHALPDAENAAIVQNAHLDNEIEEAKLPIGDEPDNNHQHHAVVAIPLSCDQTPYRKEERDRVKRMGGSIMTVGQMEGKDPIPDDDHDHLGDWILGQDVPIDILGDKPRVWLPGKQYPGCAFTRSLGDAAAEEVGVTAEPEVLSCELTENDAILILASDGIFEFLTNQEVLDMSRICGTPLRACECLVQAAYDLWMKYEPRSDDITIIVCYLKCSRPVPLDSEEGEQTTERLVELATASQTARVTKPVRRPPGTKEDLRCVPERVDDPCC